MYYCYSIKKGLFDGEMKYAKEIGVYIFYDEEKDCFFDSYGNLFDINNKKIFPRTGVYEAKKLTEAIIRHGGISLVNENDYDVTLEWPKYVKTNRKNIILSGKEILDNPKLIVDLFGVDRVFFKTKLKNYSQIIAVDKLLEKDTPFIKAIREHENEDFIISDVVDILEDESGPLEYRVFVVNGEIYNISRVHDYLISSVPDSVLNKLNSVMKELDSNGFPKSYVVDFFIAKSDEDAIYVDVLECNPIIASGTYLYNSVLNKSNDLLHSCPSKSIPLEKLKYGPVEEYGYDVRNKPVPSICYKLSGGFAADILSFSFFGSKSHKGQYIHIETEGNINPLNIGALSFIDSDSDLDSPQEKSIEDSFKELRLKFLENKPEE